MDKIFLIVIGVHKSGTTSLYKYLGDHSQIFKPLQKEIHYFTPLIYSDTKLNYDSYKKNFSDVKNEKYLLDVSPSYFYGKIRLINEIKKLGKQKIILILREPTQRFISFYKQGLKIGEINKNETITEFYHKSNYRFNEYLNSGNISNDFYSRSLREGCYSFYIEDWIINYGNNLKIVYFENLVKDFSKVLLEICEWLDIEYEYEKYNFTNENKSLKPRNQFLSKYSHKFYLQNEPFFRKHAKIKGAIKSIYDKINSKNYENIKGTEVLAIKKFYSYYNSDFDNIINKYKLRPSKWN